MLRVLVWEWAVAMSLLFALYVCALLCRRVGVVDPHGVHGYLRIFVFRLKSISTSRRPLRPRVYGSAVRWWCTLENWLFVLNGLLLPLSSETTTLGW